MSSQHACFLSQSSPLLFFHRFHISETTFQRPLLEIIYFNQCDPWPLKYLAPYSTTAIGSPFASAQADSRHISCKVSLHCICPFSRFALPASGAFSLTAF